MDLPTQEFNGKIYKLYRGEKYFSRGCKRLHRVVWEYHNGPVPKGMHIHHIDGNPQNNEIANLELKKPAEHLRGHMTPEKRQRARAHMKKVSPLSRVWHASEEGRKWHSEHGKRIYRKRKLRSLICAQCGDTYKTTCLRKNARFCSLNCKMRARTRRLQGLPENAQL